MYLSYNEYKAMGGNLSSREYEDYGYRAQDYLNRHTLRRLKNAASISEEVKRVLKRLTDLMYKQENQPQKSSESNEGMSVSYTGIKPIEEQILDVIDTLRDVEVDGVPILYRGV